MADHKLFTDREKIYTKDELEKAKLLDDELVFKEYPRNSGNFNFIGYKGNLYQQTFPNEKLIACGSIVGHQILHNFGRVPNAQADVWSAISDTGIPIEYTEQNITGLYLVSDDPTDTQKIVISGVKLENDEWVPVNYEYNLNGTTQVPITEPIMFVHHMFNRGTTCLSGNVELTDGVVIYAKIRDGGDMYNETQMARFVIPSNYIGIIIKIGSSVAGGKEAQFAYRYKLYNECVKVGRIHDLYEQESVKDVCYAFPEKTILDITVKPKGVNSAITGFFDILLIKKDVFENLYGTFKPYLTIV